MKIRPLEPSHKLLAQVLKPIGRKALASDLGYTGVSSVDKMCQEPKSDFNPDGSGQRNFLDEFFITANLLRQCECNPDAAHALGRWTSHAAGGFHTPYFEPSGIVDADFCKVVNNLMKSMAMALEKLRCSYFIDGQPRVFDKAQRAEIHSQVNEIMSDAVIIHEFIRLHKAEETE